MTEEAAKAQKHLSADDQRKLYAQELYSKFYKKKPAASTPMPPTATTTTAAPVPTITTLPIAPTTSNTTQAPSRETATVPKRPRSPRYKDDGDDEDDGYSRPTLEEGLNAWKNVFEETTAGASRWFTDMTTFGTTNAPPTTPREREKSPSPSAPPQPSIEPKLPPPQVTNNTSLDPVTEIQMESVDDDLVSPSSSSTSLRNVLTAPSPSTSSTSASTPSTSAESSAAPQQLDTQQPQQPQEDTDNFLSELNVDRLSEAELMRNLRIRLMRAQEDEKRLKKYKKKYKESAATAEQLLLKLGKERERVEALKGEIKSLTKHNVRLVEILGQVSQTEQSRKDTPTKRKDQAKNPTPTTPMKGASTTVAASPAKSASSRLW